MKEFTYEFFKANRAAVLGVWEGCKTTSVTAVAQVGMGEYQRQGAYNRNRFSDDMVVSFHSTTHMNSAMDQKTFTALFGCDGAYALVFKKFEDVVLWLALMANKNICGDKVPESTKVVLEGGTPVFSEIGVFTVNHVFV